MTHRLNFLGQSLGRLSVGQVLIAFMHAVALLAWSQKSLLTETLIGSAGGISLRWVAAGVGMVGLFALLVYLGLPEPEDEPERTRHDRWSMGMHLVYTWSLATCLGLWAYDDYADAAHTTPHAEALKVWLLALGFFGGFLNLMRSTGTRSTASTIHATTKRMSRQLDLLRRGQQTNAELFAQAVNAQLATSRESLGAALVEMVEAARAHPTIPYERLAVTLWGRGHSSWRILVGSGVSEQTRTAFTQARVLVVTPGAGIVSNLAVSGDRMMIEPDVEKHEWYKPDIHRPTQHSGMAVVMIENSQGESVAALCLTARPGTFLPSRRDDGQAYQELVRLLMAWKIAFTLPVVRLMELRP